LTLSRMDPALLMKADPPVGALRKMDPIDMSGPVGSISISSDWTGD
jgi:hypothetical protein